MSSIRASRDQQVVPTTCSKDFFFKYCRKPHGHLSLVLGLASNFQGRLIIHPFYRPMIDPQSIILLHC